VTAVLEVAGLSSGYGRVEVLRDVDLVVGESEIVALVGSNGAGKTTLLRTVSGLLPPTAGQVSFAGEDLTGIKPERVVKRGIAHVPEGRHLFSGLTVKENLMAGAFAGRDGPGLDRALEVFPHLKSRLGQVAASMSGGEQQMCAVARGLMSSPRLLMIDELSLGLAPKLVDEMLERLTEVAAQGTALLIVEQDVDAALRIASRGYVLETGRMVSSGESAELLDDPRVREAYLGVA
jgi:branched-chain amino acid transport system ATP-binding protein